MTTNGFQNKYTQLSDMSPRIGISGIIFNANLFLKLSPTGVPKPNHTLLQLLLKHSKASQQSARDVTKNRLVPRCLYTTRFQLILSVRKFSGVGLKLTLCQSFGVQDLPKSGNPVLCPPKQAILRCFFAKNLISWPIDHFLHVTHILKALIRWSIRYIWRTSTCILRPVRFLSLIHI